MPWNPDMQANIVIYGQTSYRGSSILKNQKISMMSCKLWWKYFMPVYWGSLQTPEVILYKNKIL